MSIPAPHSEISWLSGDLACGRKTRPRNSASSKKSPFFSCPYPWDYPDPVRAEILHLSLTPIQKGKFSWSESFWLWQSVFRKAARSPRFQKPTVNVRLRNRHTLSVRRRCPLGVQIFLTLLSRTNHAFVFEWVQQPPAKLNPPVSNSNWGGGTDNTEIRGTTSCSWAVSYYFQVQHVHFLLPQVDAFHSTRSWLFFDGRFLLLFFFFSFFVSNFFPCVSLILFFFHLFVATYVHDLL